MMKFLLPFLLILQTCGPAFASNAGYIDANGINNMAHTKSEALPNASGTLSCIACTETLSNKTLVAPALGTPVSGVMTNVTGTASGLTAGHVTTNANLTGPVTSTGNATAIANGAITIAMTGATPVPTASTTAMWDANVNFNSNAFNPTLASTATAASSTTLTVASAQTQIFTGSTTQQVNLPVASTLAAGQYFVIQNLSSGTVTVKTSGANTIQAMASNTQLIVTCINPSGGTGTASWNWAYSATQNALGGGGTVTSVTFTGDGTVLSSTPSSAVTTSGTVTATLLSQAKNTFLAGPTSGSNAAPTYRAFNPADFTPPTGQVFTSTGSQTGWIFTVSSANATVGATYTNNSNTYTVLGTISSGTLLYMSGTGATSGSTLTKSGGTGDSTITFSAKVASATYTPTSSNILYLRIRAVGGGGSGAGSGTGGQSNGSAGTATYFGPNLVIANGGAGGTSDGSNGGAGGTATNSLSVALNSLAGGPGQNGNGGSVVSVTAGAAGGNSRFVGAGAGVEDAAGGSAVANSGSGGAGGGTNGTSGDQAGGGGGAGGYAEGFQTGTLAAHYYYAIGAGGTAGSNGGTNGFNGGNGAAGRIEIEEMYQ